MNRWKDITKEKMETFLGLILVTGLIKYPKMEDYWSLDPIYYHPLFHQLGMSYNQFSLILKNWHVADNLHAKEGRDVAAAPQTPQLGGAQANFGGPS